ncbi:MAG: hypothetical protein A2219_03140 [Elusimicrobia bacterium RIFOXYA2_FULL_50_26]|nr:MAG: hypothetical protein A2219_03140 [Elusimicrobia bacterium RIFOXYA2_FULL_50_26]
MKGADMAKIYLGIDLGGTEVKLAVVDAYGNILEHASFQNSFNSVPEEVVAEIVRFSRNMKHFSEVSATGVGVAGDIDQQKGVVRFSPNLPRWKNTPLKKLLERELPGIISIDNDANAAAWGAYWLDAKGKVRNLICVTLGTGVGGGIICDGKLYRGATGTAGEIGHIPLNPDGPRCNCGSFGCIERYVGAAHLSSQAKELLKTRKHSKILTLSGGDPDAITPYILARAAESNDTIAINIWKTAGRQLGIVFAGIINFFNPEMIVLAGGVSKAGKLILDPIKETVRERAFEKPASICKIVISKYTQKLGVVGAAFLSR